MGSDVDATLAALADPSRRAVVDLLRQRPLPAGELAGEIGMSTAAMSRHLRVLRSAELVTVDGVDGDARLRVYRLRRDRFVALRGWLDQVEAFWADQLGAFAEHLERRGDGDHRDERQDEGNDA